METRSSSISMSEPLHAPLGGLGCTHVMGDSSQPVAEVCLVLDGVFGRAAVQMTQSNTS
jgi:hypothetical protein